MVDTRKLRGLIAENGLTQRALAKRMGVAESTLYRKMKHGAFGLDEANELIEILHIANPTEIFFARV